MCNRGAAPSGKPANRVHVDRSPVTRQHRRTFLKMAAGLSALPLVIREALAIPPRRRTGTVKDVQHVVILMQENRSFDHYFGCLSGVRGFGDPRALTLPSG